MLRLKRQHQADRSRPPRAPRSSAALGRRPRQDRRGDAAREILIAYRYQPNLEKRHLEVKPVHNAAPVTLKGPFRIEALFCCQFTALQHQLRELLGVLAIAYATRPDHRPTRPAPAMGTTRREERASQS